MSETNRDRYNDLRGGIRALFSKIASDIDSARAHSDKPVLADKLSRLNKRYAAAIADIRNSESANEKVIDRLITEWSGAQGLLIMPELLDDTDPDIEADVSDMLIGAEAKLETLQDGQASPELLEAQNELLKETYGLSDEQCTLFAGLEAAEDILEVYQESLSL